MGRKHFVTKQLVVPEAFERFCADFNAGRFYEAHEHLEEVWQFEKGPVRDLYKGLIQAAAAYVHLSRGGYVGAWRLLTTALGYLEPYVEGPAMGFDVRHVADVLEQALAELQGLGPADVSRFPLELRPLMRVDRRVIPAEARRWGAWGFDEQGQPMTMEVTLAA